MCLDLLTWVLACVFKLEMGHGSDENGVMLTVPSSLHVALDPLFNGRDVLLGILEIFSDIGGLAACDEAVLGRFARLSVDGPAPVLDSC